MPCNFLTDFSDRRTLLSALIYTFSVQFISSDVPTKRVDRKAIRYALHVSWIQQFCFQNGVRIRQSQKFEHQLLSLTDHSFLYAPSLPPPSRTDYAESTSRQLPAGLRPWRWHFLMHNGAIPRSRQSTALEGKGGEQCSIGHVGNA